MIAANPDKAAAYKSGKISAGAHPAETNELLEIAASLGRADANTGDERAVSWLRSFRETEVAAPEVEIAFARIAPFVYMRETPFNKLADERVRAELLRDWHRVSALAQGLSEIAGITAAEAGSGIVGLQADTQITLRSWLDDANLSAMAAPDILNALAAYKPNDLAQVLRKQLTAKDVIVRAIAATLLGDLPPSEASVAEKEGNLGLESWVSVLSRVPLSAICVRVGFPAGSRRSKS